MKKQGGVGVFIMICLVLIIVFGFILLLLIGPEEKKTPNRYVSVVMEEEIIVPEKVYEESVKDFVEEEEDRSYRDDDSDSEDEDEERDDEDEEPPEEDKKEEVKEEYNKIKKMEKGYGFWVYGSFDKDEYDNYIEIIEDFNSRQNDDDKEIKYLFVWAGELRDVDNTYFYYNPERAKYLDENVDMEIHALISCSSDVTDSLGNNDLDRIADEIVAEVEFEGIHLDLEPHNKDVEELALKLEGKTNKAISVALGKGVDEEFLASVDFTVLMNYAQCQDTVDEFYDVSKGRLERYYKDCVDVDANCMNGIMVTPTSCEKEDILEHTNKSILVYHEVMDEFGESNMMGINMFRLNYKKAMPGEEVIDLVLGS